jgi:hypothetical protein
MVSPSARAYPIVTTLINCRTFPGHLYALNTSSASRENF